MPTGPIEEARKLSAVAQAAYTVINIPSNTMIVGNGDNAKIINGSIVINENAHDIYISNIAFQDAIDFFPQWDPTDGNKGNWNANYDSISIKGGQYVYIDHCSFSDGDYSDESVNSSYFRRKYEQRDGCIDITNNADFITVSWSKFENHDKNMLIGNSDSLISDIGKLRVTLHHNVFDNVKQRSPRVRFGKVHLYNNYYKNISSYAIGIGVGARIYGENNYFGSNIKQKLRKYDNSSYPGAFKSVNNTPSIQSYNNSLITWYPDERYRYQVAPASKDAVNFLLKNVGPRNMSFAISSTRKRQ